MVGRDIAIAEIVGEDDEEIGRCGIRGDSVREECNEAEAKRQTNFMAG
jgi:hypothetical protein